MSDTGVASIQLYQNVQPTVVESGPISVQLYQNVQTALAIDAGVSSAQVYQNLQPVASADTGVGSAQLYQNELNLYEYLFPEVQFWGIDVGLRFVKDIFGTTNSGYTTLLGTATNTDAVSTRLTNSSSQVAGAFYNTKRDMNNYTWIEFDYTLSSGGADGFTVAFLSSTNYPSAPALGGGGNFIGIIDGQGLYIEFRTWSYDGLWITPFGQVAHHTDTGYRNSWDGTHKVRVDVQGNTVTVKLDGTTIHTGTYAKPANAWIGVTAGTGAGSQTLSVYNGKLF